MESYSLAFETSELIASLDGKKNYILSKDRKAWLNNYPEVVSEIDEQLRKYFEIPYNRKLIFSFYDLNDSNALKIHPEKENVVNRIIISTNEDEFNTNKGKSYHLNSWEAYALPTKFKFNTDIYFTKKIKNKKIIKKNKERYVMIFEYIFNKEEINNLFNLTKNDKEDIDKNVDEFLNL